MFDDIIVPKSYLKDLLTKEQEKLIKNNNYQTKCLENALNQYKLYKQKLFIEDSKGSSLHPHTGSVNFYDSVKDEEGNRYWIEFCFVFKNGIVDSKALFKLEMEQTASEILAQEEELKKRHKATQQFQNTFKYKFYSKLFPFLDRFNNWVKNQTILPKPKYAKYKKNKEKLSLWRHL